MSEIDIGTSLDDLLSTPPKDLNEAFAGALTVLQAKVASHRILLGPKLPDISSDLDEDQQRVISCDDTTVRLLAPAGAGKTHCIVNRVLAYLHAGSSPQRLLLVTFDNNSANELRGRVRDLLGHQLAPNVSTLNAFGRSLLSLYVWNGPAPRLINEARGYQNRIVKDLLQQVMEKDPRVRAVVPQGVRWGYYLQLFSYLKNQIYSPRLPAGKEALDRLAKTLEPILDTSAAPLMAQVGGDNERFLVLLAVIDWLFRSYEKEKEKNGYIDFDDQKLLAHELLMESEGTRRAVQLSYDHVIVDEFQDLNELDFRLILAVAEKATLLVVGDDDQAIYGFRGTSPRYIIDLPKLSRRAATTLTLNRNYRSPANIVKHATALIRHNTYRIDKNPIPKRDDMCDIRVYHALTPSLEASMIGDFIHRIIDAGKGTTTYRDIAVLLRMNSQSLPIQLELLKRDVPYYCRKEDNILGQEYLPRIVSILRYVSRVRLGAAPDIRDFMQVVRGYFYYLKDDDAAVVSQLARRYGPPFYESLDDDRIRSTKIGKSNLADVLRELLQVESPLDTLMIIGDRFKGVQGMIGTLEDAASDQLPLGELGDIALRFPSIGAFAEFLEDAITRAKSRHTDDFDADSVRLLTYFRSKGAQFDTVILPSLNSGIIPHSRAPIEDERRLFYVAVTRTKKNLWLSYVKRVCNKAVEVSPFLKELDLPRSSWV